MAKVTREAEHVKWMNLALEQARKCTPTPTAFCVGAVIVAPPSPEGVNPSYTARILATGYSRELPGNTHAEACAIDKLLAQEPVRGPALLQGSAIYTTMEPCSVRLSGNTPCVDRCIQAKIAYVYMGVEEPTDFVECEGIRKLKDSGAAVFVVESEGLREECLREARRGH
ncbi:cytidine deaminase-like protein [Meredithblackwellia eburnea MCA 4105]